jgi:hypothetical protein
VAEVPTELADRLYAVPPRRFVAERDAAIERARSGGDTAVAAALSKLRRPTVAAWLVNLLALRRPELLAELVELAAALREAQRRLQGGQLRELAVRRREAVAGLLATARSLAVEVDPELAGAKLPLAEVEATLTAALADEQVAAQVRAGRLLRPAEPAGFGASGIPVGAPLRLVPGGADAGSPAGAPAAQVAPAPAEFQAERDAAQTELDAAQTELAGIAARKREVRHELAEIEAAVSRLEAELAERRAARAGAAGRLAEAEAVELQARRAVAAARRRLASAG